MKLNKSSEFDEKHPWIFPNPENCLLSLRLMGSQSNGARFSPPDRFLFWLIIVPTMRGIVFVGGCPFCIVGRAFIKSAGTIAAKAHVKRGRNSVYLVRNLTTVDPFPGSMKSFHSQFDALRMESKTPLCMSLFFGSPFWRNSRFDRWHHRTKYIKKQLANFEKDSLKTVNRFCVRRVFVFAMGNARGTVRFHHLVIIWATCLDKWRLSRARCGRTLSRWMT